MSEAIANDQPADASELARDTNKVPYLTEANTVPDDISEMISSSAQAIELAQKSMASASTTKANEHDKFQSKTGLPCHFMKIPPEIRLEIYKNVFSEVLEKGPSGGMRRSQWAFYDTRGGFIRRHIKTALAMVHTSHIMRIEALPVCQQLTDTVLTSVVSELDQLSPEWRTWSIYGAAVSLEGLLNKEQRGDVYKRCCELEARYDDVHEIEQALQLVNEGLHRDHDGVDRCEGKE